ncbi:MAG TPA: SDR family NAD(P)-dependent oxidoreductase, partial [bacterium]|nr:SDR family NAD(P)-dependent oxidoreductase [bacterium]
MSNKVCIITGANSGIGKETASGLADLDAEVVMLCRNKEKGRKAQNEIIEKTNNKK